MIRAVFLDIDGTLVSLKTHRADPRDITALAAARKNGVKLFVATGRHVGVPEEGYVLDGLFHHFDGFVCLTGQYCYLADGTVVRKVPISRRDLTVALEMVRLGHACTFNNGSQLRITHVDDVVRAFNARIALPIPPVGALDPARETLSATFYMDARTEHELLLPKLLDSDTVSWTDGIVDIVPRGGGKQNGIQAMADHFGIPISEVMAIGDGNNDLTMIEYAGVGVAMGGSPQHVKDAADFVTLDCEDAGISAAFKQYTII